MEIPEVNVSLFFFKQKTAYEIMPSLVGSEMCIRDSINAEYMGSLDGFRPLAFRPRVPARRPGHLRPARQVQEHPMRPGRDDPVVRTTPRFLDSHPPSMNQTQGVLHA
eukprot:TRINITY_DN13863_c0_g1_i1.p7 TRINITY_DN13863_c0_g1~~TRINITY_DN13863_c0_g1_i1.p7  ORF type:complete len:108 (-),score=6.88 TRINITY_DN13863_c0_g1_i1:1134-1457(-)